MARQTVLITGANRGIGRAIATQMANLGWQVIATARNAQQAEDVADSLGGDALGVQLDVTDTASIQKAHQVISRSVSHVDVLVNNAAIMGEHALLSFDLEEMETVMDTNVYGPIRMVRQFMPLLSKSDDPRVINVSSGMGELASLQHGGYAAYRLSKVALNAFTILLAGEAGSSMKVFAMCPGWVKTVMGGRSAPRSSAKGAETVVWLATEKNLSSGKFYRDKQVIAW